MSVSKDLGERRTITVLQAGRALDLACAAAYRAARRGDIPTIRIGRTVRVPIDAFEAMLAATNKREKPTT